MKNPWLKFCCFLTGYNYGVMCGSSGVSTQGLKRDTSALLIICLIWSFIGYQISIQYFKISGIGPIIGGIVMCFVVIQIERQILLATHRNIRMLIFRFGLACIMAILGSVIFDQIFFKQDIDQERLTTLEEKVQKILPPKEANLKQQIEQLKNAKANIESIANSQLADIQKHPTIKFINIRNSKTTNSLDANDVKNTSSNHTSSVQNPMILNYNKNVIEVKDLQKQIEIRETELAEIRPIVEKEIKEKSGLLDEVQLLFNIIVRSSFALAVYLLCFLFFFFIEMFIVVSKWKEEQNDYTLTLMHHMELQTSRLTAMRDASKRRPQE